MINAYGVTSVVQVFLTRTQADELRSEIGQLVLNGGTQLEQLFKALGPVLNNTVGEGA